MDSGRPLNLGVSPALKEKRLAGLLQGRDPGEPRLREAVQDAQALGSLELAGIAATAEEVRAARRGEAAPAAVRGLVEAQRAVDPGAPFGLPALVAWHAAATGSGGAFRAGERGRRDGAPAAPAAFVPGRLAVLEQWLNVESSRELKPHQLGALVLARLMEILPFDQANGRVARLAASHLMVRAGARPPILAGADEARFEQALQAAFQLYMEPLGMLLEEASGRCLDVLIATVEGETVA